MGVSHKPSEMKHLPAALLVLVSLKLTFSDNAPSKFSEVEFQKRIDILGAEFATKVRSSEEKLFFKALVLQHSRDFHSGLVLGPVPLMEVLDDIISTLAGKDGRVDADVVNKIWSSINLKEEIEVIMEENHRASLKEKPNLSLKEKIGVNLEKETEEKSRNIMENKGVKDRSIMKEKARKSLKKWNGSNLRKAGNIQKVKLGKSLNEKTVTRLKEEAATFFNVKAGNILKKKAGNNLKKKTGKGLRDKAGNSLKRKSGESLNAKTGQFFNDPENSLKANDVIGKEKHLLSVISRKKKIPERQKHFFRISRSVSEDYTTTLYDDLETYTTQAPLTEKRKSFLLSFFDAIKTKFDKEKE